MVTEYIRDTLCADDPSVTITETSPLFELGILNSLKTAMLLNFVQAEFGVKVPPLRIEFRSFRDAESIAALIEELQADTTVQAT
jgi:clorobiocin biosynthesis protein CloN5